MDVRSSIILKVLINRHSPKEREILLSFLPKEEGKFVSDQKVSSADIMPILNQPQKVIERMHYSWIEPLLEKFPKNVYSQFLGALTSEQVLGLKKRDAKIQSLPSLSKPVKHFLINQIYSFLEINAHLPLEYLPETELYPLVQWSKKKLVLLIDFLGLHDLAAEIRQIVDKNQLKNFYNCLSSRQLSYLKICMYQKERLITPRLGIDPVKGDCEKLKQILHRRGLIRLGNALSEQHPDLIWYIAHILDVGRGKLLLENSKQQPIPQVSSALKLQVINLMNFLKKE